MPLPEAVALLTGGVAPVALRDVTLAEAIGQVAGADIINAHDLPQHLSALRDGWAVKADEVLGASPYAPILLPRAPNWVESGAAMPEGTDAVLPAEAFEGRSVVADAPVRAGTRAVGEEIAAGTRLMSAGARITPLRRLALEEAAIASVAVRSPCLRLVISGSPETESLSPLIAALAVADGAIITGVARPANDADAIAEAIRDWEADATMVIGGTGFGRGDHAAAALTRAGRIQAHGIALTPGETTAFGEVAGRPVLLLPGRPDAALSAYLTLGRPLIAALTGATAPATATASLLRKVTSTIGLSEIAFARRDRAGLMPLGAADLPLRSLIEADAAILVPAEAEGYPAGTPVAVLPL